MLSHIYHLITNVVTSYKRKFYLISLFFYVTLHNINMYYFVLIILLINY